MPRNYLVTGAGPVGSAVAMRLADRGDAVTLLTRSGGGPEHPGIERRRGDASDPATLAAQAGGVSAIFHCVHSAYRADVWERELPRAEGAVLAAAASAGAVVVFPESMYAYSDTSVPIDEDSPRDAMGGKRGVRTALLRSRAAAPADVVSVVAGDFFGPRVISAHAGERMVPRILAGKALQVVGSADQPHSFTFVPDLAAAMVAAADDSRLWNSVLHAPTGPALSQRELATAFAHAAGVVVPKTRAMPGWVLRAAGLLSADARELAETLYQFERPFVLDSRRSERLLGFGPTPLADAAVATVDWWRAEAGR